MKRGKISIIIPAFMAMVLASGQGARLHAWGLFDFPCAADHAPGEPAEKTSDTARPYSVPAPSEETGDLFQSVKDLSITAREDVRRYVHIYLTVGRPFVKRGIINSLMYNDMVKSILPEYPELPAELSLLPLIESAYNPYAVSRSNAVGMWQFVRNTSDPLGLKRDRYIDERRDVEKSTRAALRHLRGLYNTFGSWELALAAYNGGAGHVRRAMIRTGRNDFRELAATGALRRETSEYVPRFLALLVIYQNQALFGLDDEIEIPQIPETDIFTVTAPVNLRHISRLSGVPMDIIRRYNPQLKLDITPPWSASYAIRLPREGIAKLEEKKDQVYAHKNRRVTPYRVKEGDCLSSIARRYNKKTSEIMRYNNIRNPRTLQPGRIIYIPH